MLDDELVKKMDEVDDKLWEVAHQLNDWFDVGLDFDSFEHSEFSINIREALLEEMKRYKEVELTYDNELNPDSTKKGDGIEIEM